MIPIGGRMFLTIVAGLCFGYLCVMGKIEGKEALIIITTVFALYFSRNDRTTPGAGAA